MSTDNNQENKKYLDLIDTARELFFRHGTKRVTVEEICEKAEVSKMTFYKYFKNKNDILLTLMKRYFDEAIARYEEVMDSDRPFIGKFREIVRLKIEYSRRYSEEFITEFLDTNEELKNCIHRLAMDNYQMSHEFFVQGQELGVFSPSLKPEFLIYAGEQARHLINDEMVKKIYPDVHERMEAVINLYFYGLTGPAEERDFGGTDNNNQGDDL